MRRGCIAIGRAECDGCNRPLQYGEHYLAVDEEDKGKQRLCPDCCVSRGYVTHRTKRGKAIDTFLPGE